MPMHAQLPPPPPVKTEKKRGRKEGGGSDSDEEAGSTPQLVALNKRPQNDLFTQRQRKKPMKKE